MKIFTTFDERLPSTKPDHGPESAKTRSSDKSRSLRPAKLNLSAQEIRDRVELNSKKKMGPMKIEKEAEETNEDIMLKSDIAKNDPTDPNTQEKLKTVLKQGSFGFSDKEKAVLSQILGDE